MLQAWSETPLHLLITSQTRDIFTKGFGGVTHMVFEVEPIKKDIEIFVASKIETDSTLEMW
jgi:hypothetical protein